jgi:outer membrane protein OmpA-like peptidoglycan-associated protein
MRHFILIGLACTGAVAPALGQRAHQFEFGALGSYTRFDQVYGLENQFGADGRLGYFFSNVVGLEVELQYQQPQTGLGTSGTLLGGSASLVVNFGSERNLFYILGGYSRLDFGNSAPYQFTDNAIHGAIGDRVFLSPTVALRGELRGIYAPETGYSGSTDWAGHLVASFGLSFFTAGGPPADLDRDYVADKKDKCPATPGGATVDPVGCPSDTDRDGSFNGLDACPNTPSGALIDRAGCPLDSDRDAIADGIDQCPGTLVGAVVDARGCHSDADSDRVPDGVDQCPNTVPDATVDATGCPVDSDRDGVADGLDSCPSTPVGAEVDKTGCERTRDSDGDGIADARDRCPETAPSTRVDASGCPILFTTERAAVVLRGVTFETGRATLRAESHTVLDIVAASLVANPDIMIEVGGHTDNTGAAATNTRLSQARAEAVQSYLASRGVSMQRMTARGYGSAQPVAPNGTASGRAQNRRVELRRVN